MSLSVFSLNARGLRQNIKRKALFLFAKQQRADFSFFQETHSVKNDTQFWKAQWGGDTWLSHGSERAAGTTILKNSFAGDILHSEGDPKGHFLILVINIIDTVILLVNTYRYNSKSENDTLLDVLEPCFLHWLSKYPNAMIVMGGDFNIALDGLQDRWPPRTNYTAASNLIQFMHKFNITDIWRQKNPDVSSYTWSNKACTRLSQIDFWLVSTCFDSSVINVNILTTPLTDHKAISIQISLNPNITHRSSYWKLNSSILKHDDVCKNVHSLIDRFWRKAVLDKEFCSNWELLKFELSKFLKAYESSIVKAKKAEEENLISEITSITQNIPGNLTESEHQHLINLQNKLGDIYRLKAEGAFVRSRKRWLEEGELNTAYFFQLKKFHAKNNTIQKLNIDGDITDDPRKIAKFCSDFYTKLYESKYSEESTNQFLRSLTETKCIATDLKEYCDKPLTLQEVISAIEHLKTNKSPGTDGITSEFYNAFSKQFAPFLLGLFLECIGNESLPPTLTQGLITLIPKPKKDPLLIDNWRPISLLNNDYKIFALVFAKRIKTVLEHIIDETQSGFMRNRHISNNIKLVLDLIDYSDLCSDESFILFVDFYKAFDTIEHKFIFHALEKFGFGSYFSSAIKAMYTNGNSSIRLHAGTSPRFFLSSASQLADDTTLFLKDLSQIPLAIVLINAFSAASGLCLNIKKCELLALKHCDIPSICNIPVKDTITYLGIVITKDREARCNVNFDFIIDKT